MNPLDPLRECTFSPDEVTNEDLAVSGHEGWEDTWLEDQAQEAARAEVSSEGLIYGWGLDKRRDPKRSGAITILSPEEYYRKLAEEGSVEGGVTTKQDPLVLKGTK